MNCPWINKDYLSIYRTTEVLVVVSVFCFVFIALVIPRCFCLISVSSVIGSKKKNNSCCVCYPIRVQTLFV